MAILLACCCVMQVSRVVTVKLLILCTVLPVALVAAIHPNAPYSLKAVLAVTPAGGTVALPSFLRLLLLDEPINVTVSNVTIEGAVFHNLAAATDAQLWGGYYRTVVLCNSTNATALLISSPGVRISRVQFQGCEQNAVTVGEHGTATVFEDCVFLSNGPFETYGGTGHVVVKGGAIHVKTGGDASICNSLFQENRADVGGAIFVEQNANISIVNSTFLENRAIHYLGTDAFIEDYGTTDPVNGLGGAVALDSFVYGQVQDCDFQGNTATFSGGALRSLGTLEAVRCNLTYNVALRGGAVDIAHGTGQLTGCHISHNTAYSYAGGVHINGRFTSIQGSVLSHNSAVYGGGVLVNLAWDLASGEPAELLEISDSSIFENRAESGGGGLHTFSGVQVTRCNITNNFSAFVGGGVYLESQGRAHVRNSSLSNNTAVHGGGGIGMATLTQLNVENSTFAYNSATYGGGLDMATSARGHMQDCMFLGNRALVDGAAALVNVAASLTVNTSRFLNNVAALNGGAIAATAAGRVTISLSSFEGNQALTGGALAISGQATMDVEFTVCTSNNATQGGAIFVQEKGNLHVRQSVLRGNNAVESGGGVYVAVGPYVGLSDTILDTNYASQGGGLFATSTVDISCANATCTWQNNVAADKGGAIYLGLGGAVTVTHIRFFENLAAAGGAVWIAANAAANISLAVLERNSASYCGALMVLGTAELRSSSIVNNYARVDGGAICCMSCMYFDAVDIRVINNTADRRGGGLFLIAAQPITLHKSVLQFNSARQGGGAFIQTSCTDTNNSRDERPCVVFDDVDILDNSAGFGLAAFANDDPCGTGGGMYAIADASRLRLDHVELANNSARLGGGAFLDTSTCQDNANKSCVEIRRSNFSSNMGLCQKDSKSCQSGSSLYFPSASGIYFMCEHEDVGAAPRLQDVVLGIAQGSAGRNCWDAILSTGQSIPSVASSAEHHIKVESFWPDYPVITSFQPITLAVSVRDIYDRRISIPAANRMRFAVTLNNSMTAGGGAQLQVLGGSLSEAMSNETVEFMGLQVLGDPGSYVLHVMAEHQTLDILPVAVPVTLRTCWIGEYFTPDHQCIGCGHEQFNLHPNDVNATCTACRAGGRCIQGQLMPKNGWWHSHPRNPELHACLFPLACEYANRSVALAEFYASTRAKLVLSEEVVAQYVYSLCNKGYSGNLCGACREGYGRSGVLCQRCPAAIPCLLLLIFAFKALLAYGQVGVFLVKVYSSDVRSCRLSLQRQFSVNVLLSAMWSFGSDDPDAVASQAHGEPRLEHKLALEDAQHGKKDVLDSEQGPGHDRDFDAAMEEVNGVFKLAVDYVQMVGIIRSVQLDWPAGILNFLSALDFTSSMSSVPIYCSLPGSAQQRVVGYTVLQVLLPAGYVLAAVLVLLVAYAAARSRGVLVHPSRGFLHKVVVTSLFMLLFFYPAVCEQLLSIFTFVRLRTTVGSDEAGWFWREHPDTAYGEGKHLLLMAALGAPGVLLFSLGVPLGVVAVLWRCRDRLADPHVQAWFGMLYEDYTPDMYMFQAVVLCRQLLLLACAVLLRSLGSQEQLLAAAMLLLFYQLLLAYVNPFALKELVHLSKLALMVVQVTLLLLLYLATRGSHPDASPAITVALTTLVVLINGAMLLAFAAIILRALYRAYRAWSAKLRRQAQGGATTPTHGKAGLWHDLAYVQPLPRLPAEDLVEVHDVGAAVPVPGTVRHDSRHGDQGVGGDVDADGVSFTSATGDNPFASYEAYQLPAGCVARLDMQGSGGSGSSSSSLRPEVETFTIGQTGQHQSAV